MRMGIVLALALACAGCLPPNRPDDLGDWDACAVRTAALALEAGAPVEPGEPPYAKVVEGTDEVLFVHAKWGGGGVIAVEHFWGELLVALPAALRPGQVLAFDAQTPPTRAQYREGHSVTSYQSGHVHGRVTVIDVDEDEIALAVELTADGPVVDRGELGPRTLRGRVAADRESALLDCF